MSRRVNARLVGILVGILSDRLVGILNAGQQWVLAEDLEWIQLGGANTPKAVGGHPASPEDDGEAMSRWYDALCALLDPDSQAEFVRTALSWKVVLPWALVALYVAYTEQETVGSDTLTSILVEQVSGPAWGLAPSDIPRNEAAAFVCSVIDVLSDLGAVAVDDTGVTLTPIGAFGVRYWLASRSRL
jgi:hypothetical protein